MTEQQLRHISYAGWSLATPLNLSQTVEDCTFTLKQAYADAHRIVAAVSFSGPPEGTELFHQSHLTDDAGVQLESGLEGLGSGDTGLGFEVPDDFTPSERFDLHLEVRVNIGEVQPGGGVQMRHVGPFTFDFSIPFYHARVIEMNQTLTDNDNSVSLSKISIAPTGIWFYLKLPPVPDTPGILMLGRLTLQTPDAPDPLGYHGLIFKFNRPDARLAHLTERYCISDDYFDEIPLCKQNGEWTLTVEGLQYRDMSIRWEPPTGDGLYQEQRDAAGIVTQRHRHAGAQWVPHDQPMPITPGYTAIPGTWVFKFTVPPLAE